MVVTPLAAALLLAAAPLLQQGPPSAVPQAPLRQTFISAAETVIDDAAIVDVKADNAHFAGAMQQLKSASDVLNNMASDDREKDIADEMKDMIFQISSCHIQAIDGTDTAQCQAQVKTAEDRAMDSIHHHKRDNAWTEDPPA